MNPSKCFQLVKSHPQPNSACLFAGILVIGMSLGVSYLGFRRLDPYFIGSSGMAILGGLLVFCLVQKLILRSLGIHIQFQGLLESNCLLLLYLGIAFLMGFFIAAPYPGMHVFYNARIQLGILVGFAVFALSYASLRMICVLGDVGSKMGMKAMLICSLTFYLLMGLIFNLYAYLI